MTVEDVSRFFAGVKLTEQESAIADKLLQEIQERLQFLIDVGLEYLTLDRLASTSLAAKHNAFSWRRRWDRAWSEPCTCWMNRPSDCTAATLTA